MVMGPFWGNVVIVVLTGAITVGCFAAMLWLLWRPGERDRRHVKYDILRPDR